LDRDPPPPPGYHQGSKPGLGPSPGSYVPYQISGANFGSYGTYGGSYGYGGSTSTGGSYGGGYESPMMPYRPQTDYWGLRNDVKRKDGPFNYEFGGFGEDNNLYTKYGHNNYGTPYRHQMQNQWTRRPGSEGMFLFPNKSFEDHKKI
jgi:hypothetical protein